MVDLLDALNFIDPSTTDYDTWLKYGMALNKASEEGYNVSWRDWDQWSSRDTRPGKYVPGLCEQKWNSFNRSSGHIVSAGTIFHDAFSLGFNPTQEQDKVLDWNDYIEYDGSEYENTGREIIKFLNTLFEKDDHINYVFSSVYDPSKEKYNPGNSGYSGFTRDQMISKIIDYDYDITSALGDYNTEAGAWIRFNPVDGKGVKNDNITAYRYSLIECDDIDPKEQLQKIFDLKLPCAAIINSGRRSIHAIVHIDAKTINEYYERVEWLYKKLADLGLPVDRSNKNPSRLTRFPNLQRGGRRQELLYLNMGLKSFDEWKEFVENGLEEIDLPDIVSYSEIIDNPPPLRPELIEGVLRQGHKMILAAPSKAGKSFALIDLMACVAEGKDWLTFKCKQGKVLYLNFEIDEASFWERIRKVYEAHGWDATAQNIDVLNMRGKAMTVVKLVPKLIRLIKDKNYSLIVLDPIYKIQGGDENSAGDIAKFTNELDKLVNETNASVVYCHHHSKGSQGFKRSIDRASGSGVFARDADTILDIIELSNDGYRNIEELEDLRAYRIEGTLREFEEFEPVNVFYDFPIYKVDTEGILENAKPLDEFLQNNSKHKKYNPDNDLPGYIRLKKAFDSLNVGGSGVMLDEVCEFLDLKERQVRKFMAEFNKKPTKEKFTTRNGLLILV